MWGTMADARAELRRFLHDGPQDRPVKQKAVVGPADGVNATFFTFEDRLVPDSLVVSYDYVEQPPTVVVEADWVMGRFRLNPPPPANTAVRARYYWQLFLDEELDDALRLAAGELYETSDITVVQDGLRNAALHYAASFAFTKQSVRWLVQRASDKFLLQESPVEDGAQARSDAFKDAAQRYYTIARELREDFYRRHGRREAPAWNVYKPHIPTIGPRR